MADEHAERDVAVAGAALDAYAPIGLMGLLVGGAIALLALLPRLLRRVHQGNSRAE